MRAISSKQRNRTVIEYTNELKGLWQELDRYRQIEIKYMDECDRTYDFLVGINQEFDQVRVQIQVALPALVVISIVPVAESRWTMMLTSQVSNGSVMVLTNGNGRNSQNKDDLDCSYCKKPHHTREKCWKLHANQQIWNMETN